MRNGFEMALRSTLDDREMNSGLDSAADISWPLVYEEAVELLRQYLRFPTVNDPLRLSKEEAETAPWLAGNEAEAVSWMAAYLRKQLIQVELVEPAPGRVNLIARLNCPVPSKPPLILLSHSDVVPVAKSEWDDTIDPFAATVRDGYLYGRGVLDLKGLGIAHLIIFTLLHRRRVALQRDVILLVVADEEAGGRYGARWLLENRPSLFSGGLVLGEGGFSVSSLWHGQDVHAIAVAEKGCLELECTVEAQGHHSSILLGTSPLTRLVTALNRVLKIKTPARVTPPTRAFLEALASRSSGPAQWLFRLPFFKSQIVARHLANIPAVHAMLHDSIALTVVDGGIKSNQVGGHARAILNIRLLPGSDPLQILSRVRLELAKDGVQVRQLLTHTHPANTSDFQNQEFEALARHAAGDSGSGGIVAPILSPAASDARFFRSAGLTCFGWVPFPIALADLAGIHGANERVAIGSFQTGIRSLYHAVLQLIQKQE